LYGLQPQLTAEAVGRFVDFEATAARYLAALAEFQPRGPYALAGYSYGGFLAFEVARQLAERGEEVELLAIVDTGPGYRGAGPGVGRRTHHLLATLRALPRWVLEDVLQSSPRDLAKRVRRHLRRLARRWVGGRVGPRPVAKLDDAFDDADQIPTQNRELMETLWRAFCAYVPKPFPGRVTLFRAGTRSPFGNPEHDLGWGRFAQGGIDICVVPGHHASILREPHVRKLAQELKKALAAARRV
jgi:thioesterase domain-containing protein